MERLVKDAAKILDLEQLLDRKPKALIRWSETESCYGTCYRS